MYRRVVSLLLLPCVLLTQSAAFGHSHGRSQPAGHDLRPHVHTKPVSASDDDGHHHHDHHHHGPDGHHHHHGEDGGAPEPDTQPTPQPAPLSDHDSNAIFLDSVDVVIKERSTADDELRASELLLAVAPTAFCFGEDHQSGSTYWTHPPPPSAPSCPLYVRHCALLN